MTKEPRMTAETMSLRALMEKAPDADFLREMIGFAAQRLMELEVGGLTGASHGKKTPTGWSSGTATATAIGKPAPARSSCAFRSCARAPISPSSWNLGALPKKR